MFCGWCNTMIPLPEEAAGTDGYKVEEIIGYRGWKISYAEDGTPRLNSPLFPLIWEPGETMIAHCQSHSHHDPSSPLYHGPDTDNRDQWSPVKGCGGNGHGCGFYAGRTREHLIQLGYGKYNESDPRVIGKVQMSGKIIPATNGYRAQEVTPLEIYVPYELWKLAAALKDVYGPHGVTVTTEATLVPAKGAMDWCKKCGAKMNRSPICPLCGYTHT
jgi:hypothetical protein